jgi:hypothetical protein
VVGSTDVASVQLAQPEIFRKEKHLCTCQLSTLLTHLDYLLEHF